MVGRLSDDLYPNSTIDGIKIGYDVANPINCAVYSSASGAPVIHILVPSSELVSVVADVACYFGFTQLDNNKGQGILLLPNERALLAVPPNFTGLHISPIEAGMGYKAYVVDLQAWKGLGISNEVE